MTLEQYAYLGEIVAAIAVIASLIYIASELRQNTRALQAQSRYNLINLRTGLVDGYLQNPELMKTLHKHADGEELSAAEETAVRLHTAKLLETWQWQHIEYQSGTLPRDRLPVANWRAIYNDKFAPNAVSEMWEMRKGVLDPQFVRFMEENVIDQTLE